MPCTPPCIISEGMPLIRQVYDTLQYLLCFGCDPKQPSYINQTSVPGDVPLVFEIRVCETFASNLLLHDFDECGLIVAADRYAPTCLGDDTVIPSEEWDDTLSFMNDDTAGKPVLFENSSLVEYSVVIVDDPIIGSDGKSLEGDACFGYIGVPGGAAALLPSLPVIGISLALLLLTLAS
jgi:hypothetical protein